MPSSPDYATGFSPQVKNMSNISVEARLNKFLRDKELLNKQLETGDITPETYHRRHEEMRRRVDGIPLPLGKVVEGIEYNANCLKNGLSHASRTNDHTEQLIRLKTTLTTSMASIASLLEDVETLQKYEAPHALLEVDLDQVHPCLECICFNQLEPMKHHEACEDCVDLENRKAWEADKIPYVEG